MNMTPEERQIGKDNFYEATSTLNRRAFMKGAAAVVPGLGALYFGYKELNGSPVKVGFIGTGDEGSVLLTQHPPAYMDIVAVADLRPSNLKRAFDGDANSEARIGLRKKLGAEACAKIKTDRKSTRLNSSHSQTSYAVLCFK